MDHTAIKAISDLALSGAGIRDVNGIPVAVSPKDVDISIMTSLMERPTRICDDFKTFDIESFLRYINRFRNTSAQDEQMCNVFGDGASPAIGALYIFDYHAPDGRAGNKSHKATYAPKVSPEWVAWTQAHGKLMAQDQFAEFIESNSPDIRKPDHDDAAPTGAQMLSLANELHFSSSVEVDNRINRTSGGVSFQYVEKIDGKQAGKKVVIPEHFYIAIPMHIGGPAYVIKVLFRYRRVEQQVKMGFELFRHHKLYEDAIDNLSMRLGVTLDCEIFR